MAEEYPSAYLAALQAEHRELNKLVHAVEASLAAVDQRGWDAARAAAAVELLAALRDRMEHHFAEEEQGGYMEEALSFAPQLGPQANKLEHQHPQLLARMTDVCELAGKRRHEPSAWPAIRDGARAAIKELLAHEAGENQIIQKAFNTDLGMAD